MPLDPIDPLNVDLVFSEPPLAGPEYNLVFGGSGGPVADAEVTITGVLPGPKGPVAVAVIIEVEIAGLLPGLAGPVGVTYVSGASRPTVGRVKSSWQVADQREVGSNNKMQGALASPAGVGSTWQIAAEVQNAIESKMQNGERVSNHARAKYQDAAQAGTLAGVAWNEAQRVIRRMVSGSFQQADKLAPRSTSMVWQEALRDRRRGTFGIWQVARPFTHRHDERFSPAAPLILGWQSRFQEAMRPPAGMWPGRPPVPVDPCYMPPAWNAVHLLFADAWTGTGNLLFFCERHPVEPPTNPPMVVVPVRRVYMIVNTTSLRRVDGNVAIPTISMSLGIDVDSWTWSFSAQVPGYALANLEPESDGIPVELEASVNGQNYRLLCESITRDRTFNSNALRIQGRGISAVLDAPQSPILNLFNEEARTAQQLMADALLDNGVPIGWDIEFGLTDWLVPEGAWSHQGSRIEAINQIAKAAGGYVQPDPVLQKLFIQARYPIAPWDWLADATPDFELPSAVTTRESIAWVEKPRYNRVYVSGAATGGILGQVTREGTAGDLLAAMVTDSLITHADAARQRGLAILADTGRQANVDLRLPVLAETGVITPGKFVSYVDGSTVRLGIVRSTSVEVAHANVWQNIGVETHVS